MADAQQPADPQPEALALRASDAERERTATLLRDHAAAGRLTPEELDERLDVAYAARTVGELDALVARPAARTRRRRRPRGASGPLRPRAARAGALLHAIGSRCSSALACDRDLARDGGRRVVLAAVGHPPQRGPRRLPRLGRAGTGRRPRGHDEARLGRGGARPRELPREPGDER